MSRSLYRMAVLLVLTTITLSTSALPVAAQTYALTVYNDTNYSGGWCYSDTPMTANIAGSCNDQISSLLLRAGWSIMVFRDQNQLGPKACFNQSDSNLSDNTFNDSSPLDNAISSFVLYSQPWCAGDPVPGYPLQVFTDLNYAGGMCWSIAGETANIYVTCNDQISSILLRSGWSLRAYRDQNQAGPSACLNGSDANLGDNTFADGSPMNDAISSFVLYSQAGCPGGTPPPTPTPPPTATPYVPPTSPRLTITPGSVDLNVNATVLLEGVSPGHRVRLVSSRGSADSFGAAVGTADSLGRFSTTIRSGSAGTATITARNETAGLTYAISAQISFRSTPPAPRPAVITGVRTTYPLDARYLQGIPVNNTIDVTIDWKGGQPGRASVIINGRVIAMRLSGSNASATINMGGDLGNGRNAFRVAVYNAAGQLTDQRDYAPWSTPLPVWLSGLISAGPVGPMVFGGSFERGYESERNFKIPGGAFKLGIPGVPNKHNSELGFFAGGTVKYPASCSAPFEMKARVGTEMQAEFADITLGGQVKVSGEILSEAVCVIQTARGSIEVEVKVFGRKDWSVLGLVADFFAPGTGAGVSEIEKKTGIRLLGVLYLQAGMAGTFKSDVATINSPPYLQWSNIRVGAGPTLEGGYHANYYNVLEFKLFLGGSGKVEFYLPRPSLTLNGLRADRFTFTGEAGYEARALFFSREVKQVLRWSYPPGAGLTYPAQVLSTAETDWQLIPHPEARNYARFQARPGTQQAFAEGGSSPLLSDATVAAVSPLVTSVYTYTQPSLALNPANGAGMLLWVHDDLGKPLGQSHELRFSRWDGVGWSTPAGVTGDTLNDGEPQVVWDAAGNAVAVWSRTREPLPPDATLDAESGKKLEIATATYNAGTGTWSSPALLTNNDSLEMSPRITRSQSGEIFAAWRQNSAGLLSGDLANPERIVVARQSGGAWQTPAVAVDAIPGLADLSIGAGTGTATIAFTQLLTATGAPSATLQLFTSTLSPGGWSPPAQLTDDQLGHRSPTIVYNAANQPSLIWRAGNELRLRNLATGEARALVVPTDVGGVDELRAVQGPGGNIAVVFAAETGQRDLYVSFYDEATGLWGQPRRLTDNRDGEAYPAVALDSTGRLLMAYASTVVTLQDRTATDPTTGQPITYTVPVEGQTDLLTLSKTFVRNLTTSDAQLTLSNPQPRAGDVIRLSAVVSNTGDLPVSPVAVQFYDGNPTAGGASLGTVTRAEPLAAGAAVALSLDYTVPASGGARELYAVVDPSGGVSESDEGDNTARRTALGPDLQVVSAAVEPWSGTTVGLTSVIRNVGTTAAPPSTITYLRETAAGSVLASEPVPALAAGEALTLTTPLDYGPLAAGDYTTVAQVNRGSFAEAAAANNTYTTTLAVRPDLLVPADDVVLRPLSSTTAEITAIVYNNGSIPALNVPVQVYRRGTLEPAARLLSQVVPSIPPGGSATVTGTIEGTFGCGIFVAANPDQALPEMTYLNNLASLPATAGACADFTYTPGTGIEGTPVTFTDTSSGAVTSWQWSFGDGATSAERNPTHVYAKPGTYDVTLRITGPDGSDEYTRVGAVVVYLDPDKMRMYLPILRR